VLYLAEFYLPRGASLAAVVGQVRAGISRQARVQADAGSPAETELGLVCAIFAPQDENCFLLYRASSLADVTAAGLLADLAFERVTEAQASLDE
jgi:hypothetical protein